MSINNSYWDVEASGQEDAIGDGSEDITGLTTDEMQGSEAETNMNGFDFTNTWEVVVKGSNAGSDGYPILIGLDDRTQLFVQGLAFLIRDWNDLQSINDDLDEDYVLVNDLDSETEGYDDLASETANDGQGWNTIGSHSSDFDTDDQDFSGNFDGQGYSISELYIDRPEKESIGLFAYVTGSVENVIMDAVDITAEESVGGLIGLNQGDTTGCYTSGDVEGDDVVGGIIGQISGSSSFLSDSYSGANISSNDRAGGIVGRNLEAEVSKSYAFGNVAETDRSGGLIGETSSGMIEAEVFDCYWDKGMTNQDEAIGEDASVNSNIVGFGDTSDTEPADEMQGIRSKVYMNAFDFANTWDVVAEGYNAKTDGYPILIGLDDRSQIESQGIVYVPSKGLQVWSGSDWTSAALSTKDLNDRLGTISPSLKDDMNEAVYVRVQDHPDSSEIDGSGFRVPRTLLENWSPSAWEDIEDSSEYQDDLSDSDDDIEWYLFANGFVQGVNLTDSVLWNFKIDEGFGNNAAYINLFNKLLNKGAIGS